jgi:hypothetical protein
MSSFDFMTNGSTITYIAATMWRSSEYLTMMAEAFKQADQTRETFAQNGTWMNRTTSVQRYAIDIYA